MGCDIHMYFEVKDHETNKWYCLIANEHANYDLPNELAKYDEDYFLRVVSQNESSDISRIVSSFEGHKEIRTGRNYDMFSLLAGVRDYGDCAPISKPRGLPEDVSEYIKYLSDRWGCDGHSHSYYTLKELNRHMDKIKKYGESYYEKFSAIMSLCEGTPKEDIRFVFWFDN